MWPSSYSSGTPKLTWKRRWRSAGGASGPPPASTSRRQSTWTRCRDFGRSAPRTGPAPRPRLPALLVELDVREAEHGETIEQGLCSVPVEHELLLGDQALRREDLPNVLVVERAEPLARERDRAGNVTASGSAVDAPAVERMQGARVDDRSGRI